MNCNLFKKKYKKYVAFIIFCMYKSVCYGFALVAEQVDAADLKSVGSNPVPVRFRPSAPSKTHQKVSFFIAYNEYSLSCNLINIDFEMRI